MLVAALDLATKTGVALGRPGETPTWWSEDLGEPDHRGAALLRVIGEIVRRDKPDEFVIEAPMLVQNAKHSSDTLRVLVGLVEIAKAQTVRLGMKPAREIRVATVRKHFLGANPKKAEAKRLVINRCRALGWAVKNDNEADALALLDCRLSQLSAAHAVQAAPLFRGA